MLFLSPLSTGGSGGGSGQSLFQGDRWFLAASGPDPMRNLRLTFMLALSAAEKTYLQTSRHF